MKGIFVAVLTALVVCVGVFPGAAFAENPALQQAIEQYKHENYEEAIVILTEVRKQEPRLTTAAFFLGLSYKQAMDFASAANNLRDAVTGAPMIKDALVELIEVLYRLPDDAHLAEAKKWLAVAERENIAPSKIAFLAGLIKQKEKKYMEAVADFERSKELTPALAQAADVQIALCYLGEKKLQQAADRFRLAVIQAPQSDLASFARRYQDMVEKRIELEKPFHYSLGFFGQHDSNLVLKPSEASLASGITDESSATWTASARVDYTPILQDSWLFNGSYIFSSDWHDNHSTTHDIMSHSFSVAPGYNFGDYALNFLANYSYVLLKQPGYNSYLGALNIGPQYKRLLNKEQILEVFAGYTQNEYFQPSISTEEDRSSEGFMASVSWVWLYKKDGFFNLRYAFNKENTKGINWQNNGHRFSANLAYPLHDFYKGLKLQASGQAFLQNYDTIHTAFLVTREDRNYVGSLGLNLKVNPHTNIIVQYTKTVAQSNIEIYDYDRDQLKAGIEYRF